MFFFFPQLADFTWQDKVKLWKVWTQESLHALVDYELTDE